jgi:hypothetical protein
MSAAQHTPGPRRRKTDAYTLKLLRDVRRLAAAFMWHMRPDSEGGKMYVRIDEEITRLGQEPCAQAVVADPAIPRWTPIEHFNYEREASGPRMAWMLATDEMVLGECYYGRGPVGHPLLCPEPDRMGWRYLHSNKPLNDHLQPQYFAARPLSPKDARAAIAKATGRAA